MHQFRLLILLSLVLLQFGCNKEKLSNTAGEEMQNFVTDLSVYSRGIDPDFIVIPQNGPELAFEGLDPEGNTKSSYLNAIDGFGIEELFYNGQLAVDGERLPMLQTLQNSKTVMVADFLADDADFQDAAQRNKDEGFICFPRASTNYDYLQIPTTVIDENTNDILNLADAQNYLYMISSGGYSTKQAMVDAISATNFDVILIDLFYDEETFSASDIQQLKTKANGGKRLVISYINVGAAESYRYYWQDGWKLHKPNWLKKPYEGYADEIWVEYWDEEWRDIIFGNDNSYMKKILDAGFDGAYLDNVEAYYFLYFEG